MTLHQNLMEMTAQLEKCQKESSQKDQVIFQLTEQNHRLEEQIRQMCLSSQQKNKTKRDPSLQANVKVVVAIESALGNTFDYSLPFDHPVNQKTTECVIKELKKNGGCKYLDQEITSACATYFANQKKDVQRQINGTKGKHRSINRSNNRKRKKLDERELAVNDPRVNLTPEERQLGQQVIKLGMAGVSSDEDSEDEDGPSDRRKQRRGDKVLRVKEFSWRSSQMATLIDKLDTGFIQDVASPAMKRGRYTLIRDSTCTMSERKPPKNVEAWMLNLG